MDDRELWDAFASLRVSERDWTHRMHLRVAWLFSRRYALDEAHLRMRVGIVRLNASHGLVETAERGYHETITRAWLVVVASLITKLPAESSEEFIDAAGEALRKEALFRHYSRERLLSTHARACFVEPDLAPLPDLS